MAAKNGNVQKLDSAAKWMRAQLLTSPARIRQVSEIWRGRGWGFRVERQHTETIVELLDRRDEVDG